LLWPTSGPDPRSPDEQKQIRPQAGRGSCTGKNDTRPVVSSSARGSAVLVNLYRKRSKAAGGQARFTACDRLGDRDQTALLPATTPSSPHEHRRVSPPTGFGCLRYTRFSECHEFQIKSSRLSHFEQESLSALLMRMMWPCMSRIEPPQSLRTVSFLYRNTFHLKQSCCGCLDKLILPSFQRVTSVSFPPSW